MVTGAGVPTASEDATIREALVNMSRAGLGFVNVLNAHQVPHRDGKPLGNTVFANMHAAYETLDPALKDSISHRAVAFAKLKAALME